MNQVPSLNTYVTHTHTVYVYTYTHMQDSMLEKGADPKEF